jgi:hypothetical protein
MVQKVSQNAKNEDALKCAEMPYKQRVSEHFKTFWTSSPKL